MCRDNNEKLHKSQLVWHQIIFLQYSVFWVPDVWSLLFAKFRGSFSEFIFDRSLGVCWRLLLLNSVSSRVWCLQKWFNRLFLPSLFFLD